MLKVQPESDSLGKSITSFYRLQKQVMPKPSKVSPSLTL